MHVFRLTQNLAGYGNSMCQIRRAKEPGCYHCVDRPVLVPSYDDIGIEKKQLMFKKKTCNNLQVYPPGIRKLLNWIQNQYRMLKEIPIIITENGLNDKGQIEDYERVSYINEYLYQVALAIHEDKVNVKGYFVWTLLDDFEFRDGLS